MAEKETLKFRLKELTDQLPRRIKMIDVLKILHAEFNIIPSMFYRDSNIKLKEPGSIPVERMEVYAGLFGVSQDALKNYVPKKIVSLIERFEDEQTKKAKSNLSRAGIKLSK